MSAGSFAEAWQRQQARDAAEVDAGHAEWLASQPAAVREYIASDWRPAPQPWLAEANATRAEQARARQLAQIPGQGSLFGEQAVSGQPWRDTPANLARLGHLEMAILDGTATDDEVAEFRALRDAHDAWIVTTPEYAADVAAMHPMLREIVERSDRAPRPAGDTE